MGEDHPGEGGVKAGGDGRGNPAAQERVCAHAGADELGDEGTDRRPEVDQGPVLAHGSAPSGGEEGGEGGAKSSLHIQRISALVRRQN